MDQPLAYYQSHPPRCLAGFHVKPVTLEGVEFDGHGEECNPTFALACSCGGDQFEVLGYARENRGYHIFVSPLTARCLGCEASIPIIDTAIHGYDPESCGQGYTIRGEGEPDVFPCPSCKTTTMQLFARFEYPDDLFDDDFAEFQGRQQDLFTWFSLHGKCSGCEQMVDVTEFECA